jgi:hypothetical protein
VEMSSLDGLQRLLAERDCRSDEAAESLARGAVEADLSLPPPSASVPCSRSLWVPGAWQLRVLSAHHCGDSAIARCPGELREADHPGAPWPLLCPEYVGVRSAVVEVSSSLSGGAVASGPAGCLVYSFDSAGPGANLGLGAGCEVVAVDARGVDGSVLAHTPDGLPPSALRPAPRPPEEASARLVRLQQAVAALETALLAEVRPIDVLSVRCAGCEWGLLEHLSRRAPAALERVCGLAVELHLSQAAVNSSYDLFLLAAFQEEVVQRLGFRAWYRHSRPAVGRGEVHPLLVDAGFPAHVGVYELMLRRPGCGRPEPAPVRPALRQSWLPAGVSGFRDTYAHIAGANLTAAVLQRLSAVHSELLGPAVDLLRAAGFGRVIVYYDVGDSDNFLSAGLFAGAAQWDVRPARDCLREQDQWDFLLLTTGDEVVYGGLQGFVEAHSHRILAFQHHKFWTEPGVLRRNLYLTPAEREHLFVFPFIRLAAPLLPPGPGAGAASHSALPARLRAFAAEAEATGRFLQTQRALLLLGTLGDRRDLKLVNRVKDLPDVLRFLEQAPSHFVLNVAREVLDFAEVQGRFPLQSAALQDVSSEELRLLLEALPVPYIWVPVAPHSHYTRAFASSIAFAFAFRKVLVMPRHLAELYSLSAAVVHYEHSVTEVDWERADAERELLLARMVDWEAGQRVQNVLNLYKCISSNCS